MKYMMTETSTHIDLGFGITAANFRQTALFLDENYNDSVYTGEMPILYLYRHSVELFLKSLITIFHRKLELPYKEGNVAFDSEMPFIKSEKNQWREITKCHDISTLYRYYLELIEDNKDLLVEKAPSGDWNIINPDHQKHVNVIKAYDFDSTYFRYPFTKNKSVDNKKFSVKKIDPEKLHAQFKSNIGQSTLLIFNDNEELVQAHVNTKADLKELTNALKDLSHYLDCIHAMSRATLCNYW
ncbi:hypothetical protein AB1K91_18780 [Terribacillus sp. 179-K 1B1 HS]|uniref:hypothetical protein n=1 Tax=Terribacillus sp. 179-K 1B1 HS TaxID=3142388 RepID=UPI00399F1770